jgi:hypothetical protein
MKFLGNSQVISQCPLSGGAGGYSANAAGTWTVEGERENGVLVLKGDGWFGCGIIEDGDLAGHGNGVKEDQTEKFKLKDLRKKFEYTRK